MNAEYAQLLTEKKQNYAEYRQIRDEAQEFLVAQRNVTSFYASGGQEEQKKQFEELVH